MPTKIIRLATRLVILVIAVIATIWFFRAYLARGLPDLEVWHSYKPEAEFRAKDFPDGISFAEYRDLESRLFEELDAQIYAIATSGNGGTFSRYNKNGVAWSATLARSLRNDVQAGPAGNKETLQACHVVRGQSAAHPIGGFDEFGVVGKTCRE